MTGVYKVNIKESEAELKELLNAQKTASGKERVQLLYLLKTNQAKTIQAAAQLIGRHRVTLQDWLSLYRKGGIDAMLEVKVPTGRTRTIPPWAEQALAKHLDETKGFESYGDIQAWLESELGVKASYKTVHKLVYYHLKSGHKVARAKKPRSPAPQTEATVST